MKTYFKNPSSLLLALLAILFSINFVQAQQHGQQGKQQGPPPLPNEQQIEKMVIDLSKELSLSEEQEKQVSDLYFTHFEEVGEIREKNKKAREADHEKMEQYREDFKIEVKSYLTKEQQKQFDEYQKKQQSNRRGQGAPRG